MQASPSLLRDLSAAFMQQMFFWGMDATASRNFFQKRSFTKTPSTGLKGTSCYSLPWEQGEIFLHGTCVGWIPENGDPGFFFIRPKEKCFLWHDHTPPVPGVWPEENLSIPDLVTDIHTISPFLSWWLDHEKWVSAELGDTYRINCHRKYGSLPKTKRWLPPVDATAWIAQLIENPGSTPRAKRFRNLQAI